VTLPFLGIYGTQNVKKIALILILVRWVTFRTTDSTRAYMQLPICAWMHHCILFYCIVSIHLCSASCNAHQSEAVPVQETQREERSFERTKRGTWLTS